jgi:hypothetical protein
MYKIVEIEPGKFKLYRKGWFFWRALTEDHGYAGEGYIVRNSLEDAENALKLYTRLQRKAKRDKEAFKARPTEYFYGEDGYPVRQFVDSNNPGY